ncbi:hypothetical protein ACJIZ3_017127 [Penstemon smallii]|uniref:Uncharacterized protein n=1 Tax=Penstemon smallii TaxID=265156 RepID=A0ABD3SVF7_9LAMI
MGCSQTKDKKSSSSPSERVVEGLKDKISLLQEEINEIMCLREGENQVYERELMVFAFKQAEWKTERKRLRGEVKKLKKMLEEKEVNFYGNELEFMNTNCIMEQIKEEKARRDEAVEKWKQLYFAIKVELDDLIQRTHQEERMCWETGEGYVLMELKKELRAKEENIEVLQAKLASMEHQEFKREREMDILRQSLRIMSYKKKADKIERGGNC